MYSCTVLSAAVHFSKREEIRRSKNGVKINCGIFVGFGVWYEFSELLDIQLFLMCFREGNLIANNHR